MNHAIDEDGKVGIKQVEIRQENKLKLLGRQLPKDNVRLTHLKLNEEPTAEITSDPDQINDQVVKFFSRLWQEEKIEEREMEEYLHSYNKTIQSTVDKPDLSLVIDTIMHTNNSSPGPDGIPFVAWRKVATLAGPIFVEVIEALGEGIAPPKDFNHATLFVLPKENFNYLVKKTRPISVPNTANRIISTTIKRVIAPPAIAVLHESQAALAGRDIGQNVIDFNEFYYSHLEKGTQAHLLFLDFEKAFDSVSHKFILKMLEKLSFPRWVINTVKGLLNQLGVWTTITGATPRFIEVGRGVKQGCPLSPLLYCYVHNSFLDQQRLL